MIDFINDHTGAIADYADSQNLMPDFVKEASFPDIDFIEKLNDRAFADAEHRLYPCIDKAATVMSAIYCAAQGVTDSEIVSNIEKAAAAFGVETEVKSVFEHFNSIMQKEASATEVEAPMEKFALSLEDEEGNTHNYYNISSKADTLLTIRHLDEDFAAGTISPVFMRKVACVVAEAAKEFDVTHSLTSQITKFATTRLPEPSVALELIGDRPDAQKYVDVITKLASDIQTAESFEDAINLADDAAQELYVLDKQAGVKYTNGRMDPWDILFCGPTEDYLNKAAAHNVRILDIPVPVQDITNLHDSTINNIFSKNAANIIMEVKAGLEGEPTVEKSASASEKLATLAPDVQAILLDKLASIGW